MIQTPPFFSTFAGMKTQKGGCQCTCKEKTHYSYQAAIATAASSAYDNKDVCGNSMIDAQNSATSHTTSIIHIHHHTRSNIYDAADNIAHNQKHHTVSSDIPHRWHSMHRTILHNLKMQNMFFQHTSNSCPRSYSGHGLYMFYTTKHTSTASQSMTQRHNHERYCSLPLQ